MEYSKPIIIKTKDGTNNTFKTYTDKTETNTSEVLPVLVDNKTVFVPAEEVADTGSSSLLAFYKKDGKTYGLLTTRKLKSYYVTISPQEPEYERITVVCNGVAYTKSFYAIEGSTFTAKTESLDSEYNVGTLNVTSGTITGNITRKSSGGYWDESDNWK